MLCEDGLVAHFGGLVWLTGLFDYVNNIVSSISYWFDVLLLKLITWIVMIVLVILFTLLLGVYGCYCWFFAFVVLLFAGRFSLIWVMV